jgi:non-specific serine/threonine protein kinase
MAGPELAAWLGRLDREHENLREALGWLEEEREVERGLRLASAPLRFWWIRGHLAEGRARLEALLNVRSVVPVRDEVRARALHVLGVLIYRHADYTAGDGYAARSRLEASLEVYRRLGDEAHTAAVLQDLGRVSVELGEWMAAQSFLEESLTIELRLNNPYGIALSRLQMGLARFCGGELSQARTHLEESLEMFRELDDRFCINACLCYLGYIDGEEGAHSAARSRYLQINGTFPVLQSRWGNTYMLEGFARLAAAEGQATRALHLGGATIALRETFGVSIGPGSEALFRRSLEPAWQALGEEAGMTIWDEGRAMTLEEALALALEEPGAKPDHESGGVLSAREVEVLSCVAEGLTDVQVAERLYLSRHTVGHHLSSVYRKLGVQGRTAAVHKAGEMGLIQRHL